MVASVDQMWWVDKEWGMVRVEDWRMEFQRGQ